MNRILARKELSLQVAVCKRAERDLQLGPNYKRASLIMDLDSIPELDLEWLLAAPLFDFAHDIYGIRRHMDRSEYPGKLTDCFWPRACRAAVVDPEDHAADKIRELGRLSLNQQTKG